MSRVVSWMAVALVALAVPVSGRQADDLASPKLRIEWAAFKKLYDEKKIVVVDVRDETSFESGHIPGARVVPLGQVEKRAAELKQLGKPIVFYCA